MTVKVKGIKKKWGAPKAVQRGKFIVVNGFNRKDKRLKINEPIF